MMSLVESGSLKFGLEIDKLLSTDTSTNVVLSPFSLSTALAMTLIGAENQSGEELSTVLFGKVIKSDEYPTLAKEYQILVDRCVATNGEVLKSANFLYSHKDYPILQNYKQMIETSFAAKSQELDFISGNKEAIETINKDINTATNGKIPTLFEQIDINTKMVLANALYFKGLWKSKFKSENTKNYKFIKTDKSEAEVQMMFKTGKEAFARSDSLKCSAIQLGYEKSNVVMTVLLPDEDSSVGELKSKLNDQTLNQLLNAFRTQKVDIYLPKFKIESTFPLIPVLAKMGIKEIFDVQKANFSGITSDPLGLYVGDVIQKAVIEVNEEGTEAAAATGIHVLQYFLISI